MKNNLKTLKAYQKETLVCRWKKITWWRTSSAQQKRGEDFYNRDIVSRWLLRRSDLMMTEEVPHGYVLVFQQ
jgi:hypothetical protein